MAMNGQYNPFAENGLQGTSSGKVLPRAPKDLKIHWISENVQMERFYH